MKTKMIYSRKNKDDEEDIESKDNEDEEIESEINEEGENSINESAYDSEAELYKSNDDEKVDSNNQEVSDYTPTEEEKENFTSLLTNIRSNVDEVTKKMSGVLANFSQTDKAEIKYGISYLDSKNNFLLIYLTDLLLYSLLKTNGKSINKSPIIKRMIYLKTILEKTKVIDLKLKTQIDRLLKLGEKSLEDNENKNNDYDENNFRPRILDNDDEAENEDEDNAENDEVKKKQAKYEVKKNFQEFFETTTENKSRKKQIEKAREKVRNSEMYIEIREQFNDTSREINNYDSQYSKFMKEVEDYEDDHFTRVKVPKREMKKIKKLDRKDNDFSDIGKEF